MGELSQLGISGLALAILFFIVRYFVDAMKYKDNDIKSLFGKMENMMIDHQVSINTITERYQTTVNQYMKDGDESRRMQTSALQNLTVAVQSMNRDVCELNKK